MLPGKPVGGGRSAVSLHALCAAGLLFCQGSLESKASFFVEIVSPMVAFSSQEKEDGQELNFSHQISKNHE